MARFHRFTREDWYGYEGAEYLPDGSRPFISENSLPSGSGVTYLITGEEEAEESGPGGYALSAHIYGDAAEGGEEWWYRSVEDAETARRVGTLLPADADRATLRALGFRRTL